MDGMDKWANVRTDVWTDEPIGVNGASLDGRHCREDWKKTPRYKERCKSYEAEVLACMDEMERIKPGINAEADAFRLSLPEAPLSRPPPVGSGAAGAAAAVAASGSGVGTSGVGSLGGRTGGTVAGAGAGAGEPGMVSTPAPAGASIDTKHTFFAQLKVRPRGNTCFLLVVDG